MSGVFKSGKNKYLYGVININNIKKAGDRWKYAK